MLEGNFTVLDENKRTRHTFYEMRLSISQKNGGARYDAFHIRNTLEIFLRNRNAYQTH